VSRYSGVNATSPLGPNVVSANTRGLNGACSGGTDNSAYSVNLPVTGSNAVVYSAVGIRHRTHTPGAGYTERVEFHQGSSGEAAGIAVQNRTVAAPGSVVVNGSVNSYLDWAVVTVELRP